MKFSVISDREKDALERMNQDYYCLPMVEHSTMVPLYTTLSGTSKLRYYRNGNRNGAGVNAFNYNYLGSGIYVATSITYKMIYIDVVEHYKELHEQAASEYNSFIDIKAKDSKNITYTIKSVSLGFPEQKYIQDTLPTMLGDMIDYQLKVDKELEKNNLILL